MISVRTSGNRLIADTTTERSAAPPNPQLRDDVLQQFDAVGASVTWDQAHPSGWGSLRPMPIRDKKHELWHDGGVHGNGSDPIGPKLLEACFEEIEGRGVDA